jgi:hypothetical protein
MLSLTIKGERELRDLARDLRRAKGTLRQELTTAFKRAGEKTLKQVKHNMTSMQIQGYKTGRKPPFTAATSGGGIRSRIARVTEFQVKTGSIDPVVRFIVRTDQLGAAKNLPFHLDSGKKFRHPIMGHRGSWAANSGKPWFYDEIKKDRDSVLAAECDKAITRTVQKIEKG